MKKSFLIIVPFLFLTITMHSQEYSFKDDNISVKFTEFKAIGEQLHCKFIITALGNDETVNIFMSKVKIYDTFGNEYSPSEGRIGKNMIKSMFAVLQSELIAGVPVNGEFLFNGAVSKRNELKILNIPVKLIKQGSDINVNINDIKVPFGKSASNEKLKNNPNYKEIDNDVFIELISSVKEEKSLRFEFLITNTGDDKEQSLLSGKCRCIDDSGNEYALTKSVFGNKTVGSFAIVKNQCVKDVPIKLTVIFVNEGILNLKGINLLELNINENTFQFKDINL